ncbi:MAG: hypothetical protein EXX96DRAFT_621709 [Benjaminiella poitrasii]|nr:MAG: hypothetical protein EXX96DRAFT_621709 [Benjaminiella poitrasii]
MNELKERRRSSNKQDDNVALKNDRCQLFNEATNPCLRAVFPQISLRPYTSLIFAVTFESDKNKAKIHNLVNTNHSIIVSSPIVNNNINKTTSSDNSNQNIICHLSHLSSLFMPSSIQGVMKLRNRISTSNVSALESNESDASSFTAADGIRVRAKRVLFSQTYRCHRSGCFQSTARSDGRPVQKHSKKVGHDQALLKIKCLVKEPAVYVFTFTGEHENTSPVIVRKIFVLCLFLKND